MEFSCFLVKWKLVNDVESEGEREKFNYLLLNSNANEYVLHPYVQTIVNLVLIVLGKSDIIKEMLITNSKMLSVSILYTVEKAVSLDWNFEIDFWNSVLFDSFYFSLSVFQELFSLQQQKIKHYH
jgi:hypothetical protein